MGLNPTILRQAQDFASFSALQITQPSLAIRFSSGVETSGSLLSSGTVAPGGEPTYRGRHGKDRSRSLIGQINDRLSRGRHHTVALTGTIVARLLIEPDAPRVSSTPSFRWEREIDFIAFAVRSGE
jgi:hypothetical protein